jgi:hypothetical protein
MLNFLAFALLLLPSLLIEAANSFPYNIRDAFCRDKLSKYNSNYTNAKIYNSCMMNAVKLIEEYERKQMEWRLKLIEQRKRREVEDNRRTYEQKKLEEKREKEAKEREYREKLERKQKTEMYESLFERFKYN